MAPDPNMCLYYILYYYIKGAGVVSPEFARNSHVWFEKKMKIEENESKGLLTDIFGKIQKQKIMPEMLQICGNGIFQICSIVILPMFKLHLYSSRYNNVHNREG